MSEDFLHVLSLMINEKNKFGSQVDHFHEFILFIIDFCQVDILCLGTYLRKINFKSKSEKVIFIQYVFMGILFVGITVPSRYHSWQGNFQTGRDPMSILRDKSRHERRLSGIMEVKEKPPSHGVSRKMLWVSEILQSVLNVFNKVFLFCLLFTNSRRY